MGPRLGPMIVTSVLVEVADEAGAKLVTSKPRGAIAKRIGDSKKLVAFDDSALGEAWARVLTGRSGSGPTSPRELLGAILLDSEADLRAPCPSQHRDLCWGSEGETFSATDAILRTCARDLAWLEAKGVRVVGARVAVVCNRRLNEAAAAGKSRFEVDLHTMERLALAARGDAGADIYALCGKVGGFDFYGERFGPLGGWLRTTLVEGRARSEYHVPTVGRLAFLRDADESHMIVGLASLIGKWARDHLMRRVVRFHAAHDPELPDASGYHDPVTTRFIEATALLRKRLGVEPECFERAALSRVQGSAANAEKAAKKAAAKTSATTSSKAKKAPLNPELPIR